MGNFSQDPDTLLNNSLARGYFRVRFQQGKPVLDRELTLAADLASPRQLAERYLGDGVADPDGFAIFALDVTAGDFKIRAGRCLVNGLDVLLAMDSSYRGQPDQTHVAALPAGASNVYLRVSSREVSAADDPDLANSGDVGFETARREGVAWEVVVSAAPITDPDHFLLAVIDTGAMTIQDRRRTGMALAALCDEVHDARGSAATLGARLGPTLTPDGVLQAGIVGTPQLANLSVTEPKIAAQAVSNRTLANGAATIQKLASALIAQGQVSVPAAVSATQPGTATIILEAADEPAFYWIATQFIGPRPTTGIVLSRAYTWQHMTTLARIFVGVFLYAHRHQILIQNPNNAAITVAYRAYRVQES